MQGQPGVSAARDDKRELLGWVAQEPVELLAHAGGTELVEVVEDQCQRTLESTDRVGELR